jgi:uncharacterized protein (DUF305 family)
VHKPRFAGLVRYDVVMQQNNAGLLVVLIIGLVLGYALGASRVAEAPTQMHVMMTDMSASLRGKTGDALDKAFINEMIVHHEGAVEMAELLLAGTKRPELKKLGNDIISAQTGEIKMMQGWREEWFGN